MKTKITKTPFFYYYNECSEHYFHPDFPGNYDRMVACGGKINQTTGDCEKCGAKAQRYESCTESGTIWYEVSVKSTGKTAQYHVTAEEKDTEIDCKKLIAAIRRCGARANTYHMDGCDHPDGYDGTYGVSDGRRGMSVNGRFSIKIV